MPGTKPKSKITVNHHHHHNPPITYIVLIVVVVLIAGFLLIGRSSKTIINHPSFYTHDVLIKPKGLPKPVAKILMKIPVLMYHYVEYTTDPNDKVRKSLTINPATFEQELKALKESRYTTYYVKDIPHILDGSMDYSTKSAVLTFDDGYEDFYTVVLPLLKKYELKATFYIINNFIGRKGFITQKELEQVRDSGLVEIGAHTMDHAWLKNMKPDLAKKEIVESKADLEKRLGIKVETIAYPFGAFDPHTLDIVKEASFSAAVSVIPGIVQSQDNLFYLYRIRAGRFGGSNIVQILENTDR